MKKLLIFAIVLIFMIPLTRTAFAAPELTAVPTQMTRLPFRGTMQSMEIYSTVFPTMSVTATGSGDGTQIGRFAISYNSEMNLLDLSATETAYFVTPQGESLQAKAVGQASEGTPGIYDVVEIYTITGGTGRFADARGTFTLKRVVNLATGITASTFEGTLLLP